MESNACRTSGGRRRLLNIWVDDLSLPELLDRLAAAGGVVFTLNPDHLFHLQCNAGFLRAYRAADIVTVDSHYVRLGLWLMGRPVRHRLTGADMVPALCERFAGDPRHRVFLLGARPGVAQAAAEAVNRRVGRDLVVGAHGPSMRFVDDAAEVDAVIAMIEQARADVLLVGLGAPKQEVWIGAVRHRLPRVRVLIGVGATIDYEAGAVRRAPPWLRRLGLEWAYRVGTEPRRYAMRYVRCSRFVWWMLLDALGLYRDPFAPAGPEAG